jgi:hypothetical protein
VPVAAVSVLALLGLSAVATPVKADGGLSVSLQPLPAVSATGDFIRVDLRIVDPDADSYSITVSWGDGQVAQQSFQVLCAADAGSGQLDLRLPLRHAYRYPGTYPVAVTVATDGCDAPREEAAALTAAAVTVGTFPSNGPEPARLHVADIRHDPSRRGVVAVSGSASDADGAVAEMRLDWGHGSKETIQGTRCRDPITYWPSERQLLERKHTYRRPGQYVVRVSTVTAGCDGQSRQTTTEVRRLRVR